MRVFGADGMGEAVMLAYVTVKRDGVEARRLIAAGWRVVEVDAENDRVTLEGRVKA